MKNNQIIYKVFLFAFFIFVSCLSEGRSNNSTKTVSVAIELEEMPDVKKYEIEVKNDNDRKKKTLNFSQKEPDFKVKLEVGNYQFRTRIISSQLEVGPWSDWSELLARPEQVEDLQIPALNFSLRKNEAYADVSLQWNKAAGADKYVIWIENQRNQIVANELIEGTETKLKLKTGEYKIGVQSVSKNGIKSNIKYFENSIFVAKTKLPKIQVKQNAAGTFKWVKEPEADVKIDLYRKAFFGDKYQRIQTLKESADAWLLGSELLPGEYRIDFQYISDSLENGPIETLLFVKKPDEKSFPADER